MPDMLLCCVLLYVGYKKRLIPIQGFNPPSENASLTWRSWVLRVATHTHLLSDTCDRDDVYKLTVELKLFISIKTFLKKSRTLRPTTVAVSPAF